MKTLAPLALATAFLVAGASFADAYERSGGGTGPRGRTYSSTGSGSCSGGVCSSHQTLTGPAGRTSTRSNSGSCSGGSCTTNHTVTGPNGNSGSRSSTFSR